ncbi:MAG TPA: APC family permease [Capillimicrobium sp.]|nr:APC family permease [Capillimicrobium sp.]
MSSTIEGPPVGASAPEGGGGLHRRALGTSHLVFFIVAASAPLTAVAGGQAATYLVTGNRGIPFLFIPLGIMLALFSVGYAAMSRHITNAGAFYAYVARGLGRIPAVGTAFVALVAYNAMQIGIFGLFGVAMGAFASDKLGIDFAWYTWCFIAMGVIAILGVLRIDLNARVLAVLLILEVLVVALFDLAILADPGPQGITATGFSPAVATETALGAALVFCVASFVGFESAAIYGEECRDPRKTVARATFIAIGLIAAFYAFSSWLLGISVGPDTMVDPEALVAGGFTDPSGTAPDPTTVLFIAGGDRLGAFWADSASLLFATSLFAALLSFHNAIARYFFALGREGVLPAAFGRVNGRTGAPIVGSLVQTALAVVIVAIFAIQEQDPILTLFTWLTNLGALGVLLLMTLTTWAVVAFFRRKPDRTESTWATAIAPAIAGILLVIVFVLGVLNFNVLITGATDAPLDDKAVILPALLAVAAVLGMALAWALRRGRPQVYERIGEGGGPAGL